MNSADFPRSHRLLTPKDYQRVFQHTHIRITTPHLLLIASQNHLTHPRLGLAITKKRAPLAVVRNQIKRHLRNAFRTQKHQLKNYDMVFLLRKNISKQNLATMHREANHCIHLFLAKQG